MADINGSSEEMNLNYDASDLTQSSTDSLRLSSMYINSNQTLPTFTINDAKQSYTANQIDTNRSLPSDITETGNPEEIQFNQSDTKKNVPSDKTEAGNFEEIQFNQFDTNKCLPSDEREAGNCREIRDETTRKKPVIISTPVEMEEQTNEMSSQNEKSFGFSAKKRARIAISKRKELSDVNRINDLENIRKNNELIQLFDKNSEQNSTLNWKNSNLKPVHKNQVSNQKFTQQIPKELKSAAKATKITIHNQNHLPNSVNLREMTKHSQGKLHNPVEVNQTTNHIPNAIHHPNQISKHTQSPLHSQGKVTQITNHNRNHIHNPVKANKTSVTKLPIPISNGSYFTLTSATDGSYLVPSDGSYLDPTEGSPLVPTAPSDGSYFDPLMAAETTAYLGKSATLTCQVHRARSDKSVSTTHKETNHFLNIGQQ